MRSAPSVFRAAPILALAALLSISAERAEGQSRFDLGLGGQLSYAFEDRALGIGGRTELRVAPVPVALAASADYFFPRCGIVGCSLWQLHGNGKLDLGWLLPVEAFVGGGVHYRHYSLDNPFEEGTNRRTGTGIDVLVGIVRERSFMEARWEIIEEPGNQLVVSLGFLF